MVTEQRVQRLRQMVDQIQRLPESPDRDRLLNEVRSRAVDVDTGVTPRALLPMTEPVAPWAPRPPKRDLATSIMRLTPVRPASPVKSARPVCAAAPVKRVDESFCMDARLSLGDSPLPYVQGRGGRAIAPWTLGLRG
jgi:hypothetical protein